MVAITLPGTYGADVRPARVAAGRKPWAKDPTAPGETNGTRLDATFVNGPKSSVRLVLSDGRKLSHKEHINRGAADRPLANAEIVTKFRDNVATAFDAETSARMETAMLELERAQNAAEALSVFSPGAA